MLGISQKAFSHNGTPKPFHAFACTTVVTAVADTVPASRPAENTPAKPVEEIIKEVPKARKQTVPVPVVVQVKPIPVIKPKIIKPVIKVLH